jgi:bifunctional oligoribonuclease and PAP phosphatase NrnA
VSRERVVERLMSATRVLCTCHRRPDADALGSALGLSRHLVAMGKDAFVYVPEPISKSLEYLVEPGEVVTTLSGGGEADLIVVTDTASASLLPKGLPESTPVVVIDHHAAHEPFGDVTLRDVEASSTGEVVLGLLDALGLPDVPPRNVAEPIYAAIVADTGGFRYSSTNARTMRLGARLIEGGAEPWKTAYHLFEGWPHERLKLLSAVIETLTTRFDGKLALLEVTRDMLERACGDDDMVEGLVNYGRMLQGVEIAVLLWEFEVHEDGAVRRDVKVSLRSRGSADVAAIAVELGGGGHRAAAGAQLSTTLEEARDRLLKVVEKVLA